MTVGEAREALMQARCDSREEHEVLMQTVGELTGVLMRPPRDERKEALIREGTAITSVPLLVDTMTVEVLLLILVDIDEMIGAL